MSTNVGAVDFELLLNSNPFNSGLKNATKTIKSSGIENTLKSINKLAVTAFSATAAISFGKKCVQVATETSNAWIGLNSILTGQGKSFQQAKNFIDDYVSDGLVPLNNAVASYKNLTLRGYSSEQIQKTMNALKNSATFARQSTYSLGDAVQTATEGLKNENSVVVDNAGVTKNVAKMWEEYAATIGKTANNLTQAEKIQAEVNGILEETKFQSNDAAIYTNTFSGKVAQLNTSFTNMKNAIGNVVQPIAKLFIPIINSAVNAVTNLFTGMASLLSLFGLKADSVESISNGIGNIAAGASDVSDKIGGIGSSAKKSAKDLKSLASFDTAQVLKNNDDSGSGSSGISTNQVDIASGIKGQAKEIGKIFENINFEPLIKSFFRVKEAVEPIIINIKNGLKWLYDNVLVPLAKWTIEDALPSFLNLVAGALLVLNPLIESFKPIFQWFWDNFLQPIATWTGGTIVKTLNSLAKALTKIGKWMSSNKKTVTNMEKAVLGFFGAWQVTKLMGFIGMSGGLISAFKGITAAIWACTGAKITDKLETMYLTALYAKDFLIGLVQGTAALVQQAAQWVINTGLKIAETAATVAYNVAVTAATATTWLFNTALAVLTSPITLVIGAIAALVAGIYLLVKNWDTVKEAGAKAWEFIKNAWKDAANWFNATIIKPISENFNNLGKSITNKASEIWKRNL